MRKALVFTVLSCIGVGATGIFAFNAGKKYEKEQPDTKKDIAKTVALPIIIGAATVGCVAASHYISAKDLAGATAAVGVMTKKYTELVQELKEKHPEELKDAEDAINRRHAEEALSKSGDPHESENRYYSPWCDQLFYATPYDVLQAEAELNRNLANGFEMTLYDYFASFPKECDIQLKEWMKYLGWYDGDTSYTYNAGYFGSYVKTVYTEQNGYTLIDFEILPDYSPEITEEEMTCIDTAIDTGTDI